MTYPRDKEFPKLTVKQADFYRAWQKKCAEKGGEKPKYHEIEGYLHPNACEYVRILIRKGFIDGPIQKRFKKRDSEFPDIGERSANVLRFVKKYITENGIAPSTKEINENATQGVHNGGHERIDRLIEAGYIKKIPNVARGIQLTAKAFPERKTQPTSPISSDELTGIPMRLNCPECRELHIDEGEVATKPHHTHACQACGHVWRPAVVPTTGVRFLPGFKTSPGK